MGNQITLQVSDQLKQRAGIIAAQTRQRIEDVLANALEAVLPDPPVELLPDDEVLALAKSKMPAGQEARFNYLLEQNREGQITPEEIIELDPLMDAYDRGMLLKAQAIREAVTRGLMKLPKP
ncbi:MAG TPA: hypothetical protein VFZ34_29930 [Blastocatellia bacterium]|nr:hypothetical protein [Blastocatellia bacterium]